LLPYEDADCVECDCAIESLSCPSDTTADENPLAEEILTTNALALTLSSPYTTISQLAQLRVPLAVHTLVPRFYLRSGGDVGR